MTPLELRQAVGRIKSFQDAQGRFDPEAYTRVLAAQRISPAQYEKDMSDQLLREKIFTLVTAPVWVDPDEAQNRYNFLRENGWWTICSFRPRIFRRGQGHGSGRDGLL